MPDTIKVDITITIHPTDQGEGGFMYDIYFGSAEAVAESEIESEDGGQCTGSIEDALQMAYGQARDIIRLRKAQASN